MIAGSDKSLSPILRQVIIWSSVNFNIVSETPRRNKPIVKFISKHEQLLQQNGIETVVCKGSHTEAF